MKASRDFEEAAANTPDRLVAKQEHSASRRQFLTRIPSAAAVALASTAVPGESKAEGALPKGSLGSANKRTSDSFQIRLDAAQDEARVPTPPQSANGDEQRYPNFIGNYHKGLPHNPNNGEVNTNAYRSLLSAVSHGTWNAFEQVLLGGTTPLVNPLAGLAFDLQGTDSHKFAIGPFPPVASQDLADEAVELYWMSLCRDVNFLEYGTNTPGGKLTQAAAGELSRLTAFKGPQINGAVTPQTLFRGFTAEDVIGPYVSQFLLKPFAYGPYAMNGTMGMYTPGLNYMTDLASWLAVQNGQGPFGQNTIASTRYTCTGRDLCVYVHADPNAGLLISFYNAGIWLFEQNAPLNPGNPYTKYEKQVGFSTFGVPHLLCLLGEAKIRACKAAWYAKWFVHRALRPEEYGGLVQMVATGKANYRLHADILNSAALAATVSSNNGTYLLPQAFPEGSPQHPSFPQGHATMAGACATILKAAFDGSIPLNTLGDRRIVTASADGLSLADYTGSDANQITVNGEINKLASNIGQARDFAGIHWRSDYEWGLRLGEAVALSVLRDQRDLYTGENFKGFEIATFDGDRVIA
jgi:membrane-associated phospholipid phosphatase